MRGLIFAVAFAVSVQGASAQLVTGNGLAEACGAQENDALRGFCVGYIAGALEGMNWGVGYPLLRGGGTVEQANEMIGRVMGYCIPPEVEMSQLVDIVRLHLAINPADRHQSARGLVRDAFSEAYPCPT
jgi:hypothetical protein